MNKPRPSLRYSSEVSFLLRLILYGGSGLDPSNAITQNGRLTRRCSCSRAPAGLPGIEDKLLVEEVEAFSAQTTSFLPATPNRLQQIRDAQKVDEECSLLRSYCVHRWPPYLPHQPLLRPYWENRSHHTIVDDLLLYDDRIVIPRSMRLQILDCIHTGHLGLTDLTCRSRASTSVWWPGLSKRIGEFMTRCHTCAKEKPTPREPLMPSSFPARPWERVATDLYDFQGRKYIIVVDYYSRWLDTKELSDETSHSVIKALREVFATHGIPDVKIKDRQLVEEKEILWRLNQQRNFDRRHRAKELPTLEPGGRVWIRGKDRYSPVTGKTEKPRSSLVTTERGTLRRNRSALEAAAKPAEAEQHSAMPACDVTPASPVPVISVLPVPSAPPRPLSTQVPHHHRQLSQ